MRTEITLKLDLMRQTLDASGVVKTDMHFNLVKTKKALDQARQEEHTNTSVISCIEENGEPIDKKLLAQSQKDLETARKKIQKLEEQFIEQLEKLGDEDSPCPEEYHEDYKEDLTDDTLIVFVHDSLLNMITSLGCKDELLISESDIPMELIEGMIGLIYEEHPDIFDTKPIKCTIKDIGATELRKYINNENSEMYKDFLQDLQDLEDRNFVLAK